MIIAVPPVCLSAEKYDDGDEQDHKDRAYADRQNAEGNHAVIPPDCIKRISTVRIARERRSVKYFSEIGEISQKNDKTLLRIYLLYQIVILTKFNNFKVPI